MELTRQEVEKRIKKLRNQIAHQEKIYARALKEAAKLEQEIDRIEAERARIIATLDDTGSDA